MKIAVFLPNWLGDVVMATPALRALRRFYGAETRIIGVMRPYLAEVLAGTGWLDESWFLERRATKAEWTSRALVQRMRAEPFDLALLFPNSLRTAWLAWRGGAKERVGYVRYGRGPLLTGKVYPTRENGRRIDTPMVDYYLRLTETLGCPAESKRLELTTTEQDERSADGVWRRLRLRDDGRVVTLNCSGAYGGSKLWPVEHFGQLARRVVEAFDHDVLVMCGPAERDIARQIVQVSGVEHVVSMAEQPLDLGTAKACFRRSQLTVSTDSGPRHVAAAFGKPLVTLFGPMKPVWSENPTQKAVNLMLDLDCIGCHKRKCPLGHHHCMKNLSVETVLTEVSLLLDQEQPSRAA